MTRPSIKTALQTLQEYFGYTTFRPGQEAIISAVLAGKNTLGVMPTGGGKSICYQIPALLLNGLTIVISPLISLMKDQIDTLQARKYPAEMINSTVSLYDQRRIMDDVSIGRIKLLYLTPERLRSEQFVEWLKNINISLFAIDEAHCISEWGHDFRPDYRRINTVINYLRSPPILALTATATQEVREDIVKVIGMKNPEIIINGFNRENLIYGVEKYYRKEEKNKGLLTFLKKVKKPGIIYTSSIKDAEEVYNYLRTNSPYRYGLYHGKRTNEQRNLSQEQFINNEIDILIATNAFGMGVDKRDIRFVVHYTIPGTIEAYYQETGRAGRDGNTSFCLLQYMEQDEHIQRFFIKSKNPSPDRIEALFSYFAKHAVNNTIYENMMISPEEFKISVHEKNAICKQLLYMGALESDFIPEDVIEITLHREHAKAQELELLLSDIKRLFGNQKTITTAIRTIAKKLDRSEREFMAIMDALVQEKTIRYQTLKSGRILKLLSRKIPQDKMKNYANKLVDKIKYDYIKLDAVINYVSLGDGGCRRKYLLNYFGEDFHETNCGKCDICRKTYKNRKRELSALEKKILMTVLLNNGRLGRVKLVKLLKGSFELDPRYQEIDEFGILADTDIDIIDETVRELCDTGQLFSDDSKYPVIKIAEQGKSLLTEEDFKNHPDPRRNR